MIKIVDLVQHYGIKPVLKNINLEVHPGELLALMGPNGMGKSTLLSVMAGILSPQKGYVEINGVRRRSSVEGEKAIRQQVFVLPDFPWLPPQATGREYIHAIGKIYGIEDEPLMGHAESLLTLFNLKEKADSPIGSYSTGQHKKVAVCAAIASEAPILLLDEPFSGGLDPSALLALKKVMKQLATNDDTTIVLATPVPEIIEEIAHRVAVIRDGELIDVDTPENFRKKNPGAADLQEVLEGVTHSDTLQNLDDYFEERQK
jgi:ABC-type multidrug transport system ATPase subunit